MNLDRICFLYLLLVSLQFLMSCQWQATSRWWMSGWSSQCFILFWRSLYIPWRRWPVFSLLSCFLLRFSFFRFSLANLTELKGLLILRSLTALATFWNFLFNGCCLALDFSSLPSSPQQHSITTTIPTLRRFYCAKISLYLYLSVFIVLTYKCHI